MSSMDADSDGVYDNEDNCLFVSNATQIDPDKDGFGTHCDFDVDNNCAIGTTDVVATFSHSGEAHPDPGWTSPEIQAFDVDHNNAVGTTDVVAVYAHSGGSIGPSGRSCADCDNAESCD